MAAHRGVWPEQNTRTNAAMEIENDTQLYDSERKFSDE